MTKTDPIIAVKDVEKSSEWYQTLLGCKSAHGGAEFDVLRDETNEVILCLHLWEAHGHPTMADQSILPGNGLILYFRTDNLETVRNNAENLSCIIEKEIHLSPNSHKREFALRDPDGYYLIISEFHNYGG